jgi:ubiquinone/menaquinone biosynthesis C-methylase UbiE
MRGRFTRLITLLVAAWLLVACGGSKAPAEAQTPPGASSAPAAPRATAARQPANEYETDAQNESPHKFDDAEKWSKVFDDPKRDAWQKPDEVVRELGLKPNAVVADLGAGTGYFSMRLAKAMPKGKVIAIDTSQGMLDHIKQRAEQEGVKNVQTVLANTGDPMLPRAVDVVLVVDTYHHLSDRVAYFKRLSERLNKGGRVVVVDYKMGKLPVGPPDGHKIPREAIEDEMKRAGYQLCRSWDGLPYQHVLFFATSC